MNEESRSVMSFEEAAAFNDGWKRGEAYGRRTERERTEPLKTEIVALRSQLDGMTEQFGWAHKYGGLIIPFTHDAPRPEDQYNTKVRRLVGPWVEVE